MIIEFKKSTNKTPRTYDELKLESYTSKYYGNDLAYQIGLFIEMDTKTSLGRYRMKVYIDGEEDHSYTVFIKEFGGKAKVTLD